MSAQLFVTVLCSDVTVGMCAEGGCAIGNQYVFCNNKGTLVQFTVNCLYLESQLLNRWIALCTIHRIVHLDFEKLIQLIKRFIPAVDSVIDLLRNWGQLAKLELSTLISWVAGCECMFYGIISVPHCRKKNMFKNTLKFGLTIGFLLKKKKKKEVVEE